jgi:hypothetical protein
MLLFRRAQYCPAPPGDSITRKSIFDALVAGCVPVIFARASMSQYLWYFSKEEVNNAFESFTFIFSHNDDFVVDKSGGIHTKTRCNGKWNQLFRCSCCDQTSRIKRQAIIN